MTTIQLPPVLRRWRFLAAVVGVTALAGSGVLLAASSDSATAMAFHPMTTTRLLDTRPASQVGTRSTPLGVGDTFDVVIPGLPTDATAVSINVTAVDGTEGSFLTLYPSTDTRPLASTINWTDAGAVANSATVNILADHSMRIFNLKGTVNVVVDLMGYYAPSPAGGAPGAPGTNGTNGTNGTDGTNGTNGTTPGPETNDGTAMLSLVAGDSVTLANEASGPTGTDSVVLSTVSRGGTDVELNAWIVVERMDAPGAFAYANNTVPETLATGTAVTFDTVGQATGIVADPGGSEIQIATTGVYKIAFAVIANGPSQLEILVNGVDPASGALVYGARG